jgi:hypothetical protein
MINQSTKLITKIQFKNSQHHLFALKPLMDGLEKINPKVISEDLETQQKVKEFKALIGDLISQHRGVIAAGEKQYQNRPAELIQQAASRINLIPRLIESEQKNLEYKIKAHEIKTEELRKKHFDQVEIDKICSPISQDEVDGSAEKVMAFQDERKTLLKFVSDSPHFDVEILKNTVLYPEEASVEEAA